MIESINIVAQPMAMVDFRGRQRAGLDQDSGEREEKNGA